MPIQVDLLELTVETFMSEEPPGVDRPEEAKELRVMHGVMEIWNKMDTERDHLLTTPPQKLMAVLNFIHRDSFGGKNSLRQ